MYRLVVLFFVFLNIEAFPQWKSYYPESKNKNQNLKEKKEKDSYLYETYFFNALKEKSLENYKEALSNFQKCIKINNKKPVPYYESAVLNKHQGNLDLAEEQIKKAVSLESENRWYILAYAETKKRMAITILINQIAVRFLLIIFKIDESLQKHCN